MRHVAIGGVLAVAMFVPRIGDAQVYLLPTPPPQVTAAGMTWQLNGEPLFYAGAFYYPTGPTVFFDRFVMVRSGVFRSVPLYTDTTLEPYSIVYVPIGGNVMRPYERRREGELAGTVGSRMPSFPIQRDVELSLASLTTGIQTPPRGPDEPSVIAEAGPPVFTGASMVAAAAIPPPAAPIAAPGRTIVESIPPPRTNAGIWIEHDRARWYRAGAAVPYSPERFTPVGNYRGFPVYRDTTGKPDQIYVSAMEDGPLIPYSKR